MSKQTKKVREKGHKWGNAWFDFDDRASIRRTLLVGIEVEHPPTDDHFLLHVPYTGKDARKAIEAAEYIVGLLNANRAKRPQRKGRRG